MSENIVLPLKPEFALLELSLMNAEASQSEFDDVVIDSVKRGIPAEIVTRLAEIWTLTKVVGGEIVAIGKIIVSKIVDFLRTNPKISIGLALGACATTLIASIPFIGPILVPFAAAISMTYGAGVGASAQKGNNSLSPVSAVFDLAEKFFELLASIFNGVKEYWVEKTKA